MIRRHKAIFTLIVSTIVIGACPALFVSSLSAVARKLASESCALQLYSSAVGERERERKTRAGNAAAIVASSNCSSSNRAIGSYCLSPFRSSGKNSQPRECQGSIFKTLFPTCARRGARTRPYPCQIGCRVRARLQRAACTYVESISLSLSLSPIPQIVFLTCRRMIDSLSRACLLECFSTTR